MTIVLRRIEENVKKIFLSSDRCAAGCQRIGHVGAGGSLGFADPECRLSFGYAMNRMGTGILLNERGQALVDAAYSALGYRSNAAGAWTA